MLWLDTERYRETATVPRSWQVVGGVLLLSASLAAICLGAGDLWRSLRAHQSAAWLQALVIVIGGIGIVLAIRLLRPATRPGVDELLGPTELWLSGVLLVAGGIILVWAVPSKSFTSISIFGIAGGCFVVAHHRRQRRERLHLEELAGVRLTEPLQPTRGAQSNEQRESAGSGPCG